MRIISGNFKNKKLNFPKNSRTRPLKDSVKENIFNILDHSTKIKIRIKNSFVLDLYSGSGSFGFECISRQAAKVFFVEQDAEAVKSLENNINNINAKKISYLYSEDVQDFIKNFDSDFKKKIDIIFVDPPYKNKNFLDILKKIKEGDILNDEYIIILHRETKSEPKIEKNLDIIERRIYGRSEIFFCKFF